MGRLRTKNGSKMGQNGPFPLYLANKQASKQASKQATSTSPFRFGHCSASSLRALLYSSHPRASLVALPNPSFEPKTHRWRPRAGAPSREVPSQNCAFCAPKQPFLAQNGPQNPLKTAKRKQRVPTLHVCLDCPVKKSPFLPSSSTICPRSGPKLAKNGLNVRCLCQRRPKRRMGRILGYVAQNPIPRAPIPPATPHFLWFPSFKIPQRDA